MSTSEKSHNHNNDEPNNTESPIVTNSQVTDEQLINWIKSRRSIGNLMD